MNGHVSTASTPSHCDVGAAAVFYFTALRDRLRATPRADDRAGCQAKLGAIVRQLRAERVAVVPDAVVEQLVGEAVSVSNGDFAVDLALIGSALARRWVHPQAPHA